MLHLTNSKRIMGSFANKGYVKIMVWSLAIIAITINVYLVFTFVADPDSPLPYVWWFFVLVICLGILYFIAMFLVIKSDFLDFCRWLRSKCGRRNDELAYSSTE